MDDAASPAAAAPERAKIDPFFHLVPGGKFNACIGRQGDVENYIDGYMEAALELASAVVDKRQYGKRDTLAMPILYNARHALELTLKFAIEQLYKVGRLKETHRANHDIEEHWKLLRNGAVGDEGVRNLVIQLEPFVTSLAAIDEDGQELRYAVNRDGNNSMEAYALVDLELVQLSLHELSKLLSALKYRVEDLREEKASGTWTNDCSRTDLMTIAKLLPARSEWNTDAFDTAKAAIRERFCLGNNKFSKALDLIQASRAARLVLGMNTELAHLTDDHALLVVELWAKRHPPREGSETELGTSYHALRDWDAIRERRQVAGALSSELMAKLSPEEIADLQTIFYLGRNGHMPEFYDEMLARTIKEHAVAGDLAIKLDHLMEKMNLADELMRGFAKLGRPDLGQRVAAFLEECTSQPS